MDQRGTVSGDPAVTTGEVGDLRGPTPGTVTRPRNPARRTYAGPVNRLSASR
jgi:hypothetical protein